MANHLQTPHAVDLDILEDTFTTMDDCQPMFDTQVLTTATWHKVVYQGINPMSLRPYLNPVQVNNSYYFFEISLSKHNQIKKYIYILNRLNSCYDEKYHGNSISSSNSILVCIFS
jgi:hypothetical protein